MSQQNQRTRKRKTSKKARREKEAEEVQEPITLKFRNYAPSTADVAPDKSEPQPSLARQLEQEITTELHKSMVSTKDEAVSITAKSPNWDLKRDISGKLKKLERMTLRAIRDLVQERIAADETNVESSSDSDSDSGSDSDSDSDSNDSNSS